MHLAELKYYDETIFNLASYLLIAPERHPHVIQLDPQVALTYPELRQLHRYGQAMIATGLTEYSDELNKVIRRFQASVYSPAHQPENEVLDGTALMRLEGLMHVCPDDPTIQSGLGQLIQQRTKDHHYFIPNTQRTPEGCTLWAVRVLAAARRIYGEEGLLSTFELKRSLDVIFPELAHIRNIVRRHRDLSLALGLYYELTDRLEPYQEDYLFILVKESEKCENLWGVRRRSHVHILLNTMYRRYGAQRGYDDGVTMESMIETQEAAGVHLPVMLPGFQAVDGAGANKIRNPGNGSVGRKNVALMNGQRANTVLCNVITTTANVIEHLAPLTQVGEYDFLKTALEHSMELWWNQLAGKDAPHLLRDVFPDDVDYIDVLCKTITAARAYSGVTVKERTFLKDLRHRAERFRGDTQAENIQTVLRSWIDINVGKPQRLELGMSGSTVVRIRPEIIVPTAGRLPQSNISLIVKYGPTEDIKREKQNYHNIPSEIQNCFVRIPDKDYPIGDRTFLVMEDLAHFSTVYEMVESETLLDLTPDYIARKLHKFLEKVHRGGGRAIQVATPKHLRDLYITPMLQDIERLTRMSEYIQRKIRVNADTQEHFATIEQVGDMIEELSTGGRIALFDGFPLGFMHGDLHTRNIMVSKRGHGEKRNLHFRLIDLEKMQVQGDVAIDAGQLIVDLDLLHHNIQHTNQNPLLQHLRELRDIMRKTYPMFAKMRRDTHFDARFDLARSRAYIRVTKSRFKLAQHYLDTYRMREATQIVMDSLGMMESAKHYLRQVDMHMAAKQV